ncbi:5-methylcytosine-specific restriction endonuclease McrA [Kineococcus xinjiangensis]|uniref:5-methylcytosine-specific restriction endonuclease McrA n=1 Tax=Kineococcus xinjiangensis TaxID=512762 RepID=A0A2S6IVD2_9ACTN|nr:HNH endonuclease [Kineococcus xinjiangensis]PPK98322.1 5-methylcytosine-specific restriction endonuclease McrA [Kineococcus xinjiangensis]
MGAVLVLNACGTVLATVQWQRAVTMLLTLDGSGTPLAVVHEADPERLVRSPSTAVPWPRAIRLTRWVHVRFAPPRPGAEGGLASRRAVLERDQHTCIYCGGRGETIDHIVPRSRGGQDSWENQAACCAPCNAAKADRTPSEARMRLRWTPWRPDIAASVQRRIWRELAAGELTGVQQTSS